MMYEMYVGFVPVTDSVTVTRYTELNTTLLNVQILFRAMDCAHHCSPRV
jgi:hypothetical protein